MAIEITSLQLADELTKRNFSRDAALALASYYENQEPESGEEIKVSPNDIDIQWAEYDSAIDYCSENIDHWHSVVGVTVNTNADKAEAACLEYIENQTEVITFDGGILVAR